MVGLVVAAASGCGGSGSHSAISVHIKVTTYSSMTASAMRSFTLGCDPAAGTLPFAARVCRDIACLWRAMLNPRTPRSTCLGSPTMPQLVIDANNKGRKSGFSGSPWCGWPGGTPLAIYFAASQHDTAMLAQAEPLLRCEDDHDLFVKPTPWASVVACTRGLWTPRSERLIRLAEHALAIAVLQPRSLFPNDIGARRCAIPAGGPVRRTLAGLCGVSVKKVWSTPTVTFVESWPRDASANARAVFQITVENGRTRLTAKRGATPPQLWR